MLIEKLNDGKYKLSISPKGFNKNYNVEEHIDKFLFDVDKTVGFRKDKKLNKFVGLRDGASKQLEFTLISVILDGVNKINDIDFNSISMENDIVKHSIDNTNFYNTVSNTNYKHLVEIKNPFKSLEILYEIHTKGIRISNRIVDNTYFPNNNNQFSFIDDGNMETLFIFDKPILIDADGKEFKIVNHKLFKQDEKIYYKKTIGFIGNKYKFPLLIDANVIINENVNLNSTGVGVISSSGNNWIEVTGGTNLSIVHNSSIGTYLYGVVNYLSGGTYKLNRTFLNFNTDYFSGYTEVLSSVKLLLCNYNIIDEPIFIFNGTQGEVLTTIDWNEIGDYITGGTYIVSNQTIEFNIPLSYFNLNGLTRLVITSSEIEPVNDINLYTGINFGETKLEVIYEPIKVYGQTQLNVQKGDYFSLTGYTNSTSSSNIMWFKDSGYTEQITIGSTMTGYSMEYQINNKIYAVLSIPSEPLIVTINVIELEYDTIPTKFINYDEIDIDSIYFKFHKCFSGICYSYVRDLNDAYEGNPLVSDSWGNESYNLYNEYDIIDEFFSNSHDVEVAYNTNLDLTKRYNNLDGVILREGTRVLLMKQTDLDELGVYVVQYDNTLVRTDEMNTYDDLFRYKAHVGAGTYADQEIHIWPILPPTADSYINFNKDLIEFDYISGMTDEVIVYSNVAWNIYNVISWISVDKSFGGPGETTITLTTTMINDDIGAIKRYGTMQFISVLGDVTALLLFSQDKNLGLIYRITTGGLNRELTDGARRIITEKNND
jgi:hypothetical protein